MAPGASSGGSGTGGSGDTGVAAAGTASPGVALDVVKNTTVVEVGLIAVTVPKGTATAGTGFSFVLPAELQQAATASSSTITVTLANGTALPEWLHFDQATQRFTAQAVPDGAFPLEVRVRIGTQRTIVVISERSSH
ncbi:MAG TPA: putative Ig domain-containing protein [Accumulibacter sp.]|nr:putative Ig domain-containing protein [Accumulibacter sp.]HNC17124.1 putative Ig domain-containing protein [Accumulibacter sp.]HND79393.1 putative Ig domain-containing protein [Accumulibacter sp.]HNE12667.1 putative Ig domain-containing protein [Accumulibacter sp.]HNG37580.1 putative Ig domain-containing protein [Accumulibacter sp.]